MAILGIIIMFVVIGFVGEDAIGEFIAKLLCNLMVGLVYFCLYVLPVAAIFIFLMAIR